MNKVYVAINLTYMIDDVNIERLNRGGINSD